jgi:dipeptidyl aminopeptidase/acylaminoacyl peptidase
MYTVFLQTKNSVRIGCARQLICSLSVCIIGCVCQSQITAYAHALVPGGTKHPVTVVDMVEMTRPGDTDYINHWAQLPNIVSFSPNKLRFAFVSQTPDIKYNVVSYSIWVFETNTALTSPKATALATLQSSSNRPAVSQLRWLPDNDTLIFLGEQLGGMPQIYRVRCSTRRLEALTSASRGISEFSIADVGNTFVYLAQAPHPVFSKDMRQRGFFVTSGHRWEDLYLNNRDNDYARDLFIKTSDMQTPQQIGGTLEIPASEEFGTVIAASPDGRYAFLRTYETDPPKSWDYYELKSNGAMAPIRKACVSGIIEHCPAHYLLLDLQKKILEPLFNAPTVQRAQALGQELATWSSNNTVLLVNALLPVESGTAEERRARLHHVYSVEIRIPDRRLRIIEERTEVRRAYYIESDISNQRFTVRPLLAPDGSAAEFHNVGDRWTINETNASIVDKSLVVSVEQDINTPPKLVASDPAVHKKTLLLDLNPRFAYLTFGKVGNFQWATPEGYHCGGQLYYPVDFQKKKRYPLVIQTHGENRKAFWIDGAYSTASAAQVLANKGFFVLQMGFGDRYNEAGIREIVSVFGSPKEGPYFISLVQAAIDQLDRRGLIDRSRVALEGFSRTVYHAEYFLTHSRYPIAAAVMADGVDYGYPECIYLTAEYAGFSDCERMNGGPPWGKYFSNWLNNSPPMRLDKINTPLLLQSITSPFREWEIYRGLQWLKKPVALVNFYPEGVHALVRPQQKLVSEQSVVDWYCFWLKSYEDPDPAKVDQYDRWRALRRLDKIR